MKGCLSLHEYIEIAGAVDEKEDEKEKTHVRFPLRQKRRQNNSSYMRPPIRIKDIFSIIPLRCGVCEVVVPGRQEFSLLVKSRGRTGWEA